MQRATLPSPSNSRERVHLTPVTLSSARGCFQELAKWLFEASRWWDGVQVTTYLKKRPRRARNSWSDGEWLVLLLCRLRLLLQTLNKQSRRRDPSANERSATRKQAARAEMLLAAAGVNGELMVFHRRLKEEVVSERRAVHCGRKARYSVRPSRCSALRVCEAAAAC